MVWFCVQKGKGDSRCLCLRSGKKYRRSNKVGRAQGMENLPLYRNISTRCYRLEGWMTRIAGRVIDCGTMHKTYQKVQGDDALQWAE